jgi:RsiW-degrading membrane proteinase PrsW (M82 family)
MDNKHNAKYAFYYLLSLVALVFTAFAVGAAAFALVDKFVPDPLVSSSGQNIDSRLRFAIAALLIAAPAYYYLTALIARGLRRGELSKDSGLRRWLTYLIILVSSIIILVSLIVTISDFLSGELSWRFGLQILSIIIIAALAFAYYLYDIRREKPEESNRLVKAFFYGTLALVVAAFVSSIVFVESPREARARRFDERLVNNIYALESAVNDYYSQKGYLPNSLEELLAGNSGITPAAWLDPETKAPISYVRQGEREFQFCADFRTDSFDSEKQASFAYHVNAKEHRAGYQCLPGTLYAVKDELSGVSAEAVEATK